LDYLTDAVESNWIAPLGPHVDAFERALAAECGRKDAAALSSGTAALHLALIVLGVGEADDVLCSTLTFAATANAVRYVGARPVFIDSDPSTWTMSPDLLEEELEARTRSSRLPAAVITVDLYGQCADYDRIRAICSRYEIPIVQDAAEALGARHRDQPAGAQGDFSVLSFNGNKIITTSGGGALLSDDSETVARVRNLAAQARDPAPHYQHSTIGYNYRLSNLLAAVGRAQLEVLHDRVTARRHNNQRYRELLAECEGIALMEEAPYNRCTFWLTTALIDSAAFGASSEQIRLHLEEHDIEARPVWKPLHLQPVFADCPKRGGDVAADLFARGLCLPSGSNLSDVELERISELIRDLQR